jgi:tRNA uridine 5-carboxymethylaminomethyl modification enzyme
MAGVNAVLKTRGEEPFVLNRSEAYIGVLIDDLVTKGTIEPYRMFTSRAEYRLLLRQDNADLRLMPYGHRFGLIDNATFESQQKKQRAINETIAALRQVYVTPSEINDLLQAKGTPPISQNENLQKIMRRPEIMLNDLRGFGRLELWEKLTAPADHARNENKRIWQSIAEQVEIEVKYEGFIAREREAISRFERLEEKKLPVSIDYRQLTALSAEAREKLNRLRPVSVGQAARISGVTPADVTVLLMHLRRGFPIENGGEEAVVSRETNETELADLKV